MHADIQAHFKDLEAAIRTTGITADRQEVIASCVRRLPALYTKLRETYESRYADEITRLVQLVLKELEACPEARKLDATFREKLQILHEDSGVSKLTLKPAAPLSSPKKTRKKK